MDVIRKIAKILPTQEFIKSSFKENPVELSIAAEFYRILNEFLTDQHQLDEQTLCDTYTMCEAIKDHLWEVINTGHFSKVNRIQRQLLTLASLEKAVLLLIQGHLSRNDANELRDKCIWELDNGLLLGCPLDHPTYCQALNDCLKIVQASNSDDKTATVGATPTTTKTAILNPNNELVREPNEICDLAIVPRPSVQHFQERYFNECWPVILTECMDQWPATTKWTQPDYLLNVCAARTVPVEIGSSYTNENWSQDLVKFEDFFRRQFLNDSNTIGPSDDPSTSNVEYLAQHNLFDQIGDLRNDIIIPEYCCAINRNVNTKDDGGGADDGNNDIDVDIKAWLGPEGTKSPMHIDEKHNLLCQVFGSKRIILAAPSDSTNLYPFDGDMLKNTSQIDPEHLDVESFPLVRRVKFYNLTLHKGEMLYIPPKWWHFVRSLSKSFSVSFWWE